MAKIPPHSSSSASASPPSSTAIDVSHRTCNSETNELLDREERAIAALVTRFKSIISLAAEPPEDGATLEVAGAQSFQMEVETNAMVSSTSLFTLMHLPFIIS